MIDFFEESLFESFDAVDFSKPVKKMSFQGKATITYQIIDDFFYLNSIWVEEEHRGNGVAHQILEELTTLADKYKVRIEIEVVPMGLMQKKDLIALYEKYGFKVTRFASIPGMTRNPKK